VGGERPTERASGWERPTRSDDGDISLPFLKRGLGMMIVFDYYDYEILQAWPFILLFKTKVTWRRKYCYSICEAMQCIPKSK
jgi:hypothetical protein